jgi:hypothetical protein
MYFEAEMYSNRRGYAVLAVFGFDWRLFLFKLAEGRADELAAVDPRCD